ncbi:hypothetical protein COCVIDRAFT_12176 [Bipolaris victoriae FI3]|uniref:Uncharacterized protein n=1 Tax=Bipolaris victoriae (strain FI3) TaxID=930091 RepID=W7F007_BIPV3|nr:hypothetical protein COCVIDRAFT_12176 [Bipolaris victoriae FI3]
MPGIFGYCLIGHSGSSPWGLGGEVRGHQPDHIRSLNFVPTRCAGMILRIPWNNLPAVTSQGRDLCFNAMTQLGTTHHSHNCKDTCGKFEFTCLSTVLAVRKETPPPIQHAMPEGLIIPRPPQGLPKANLRIHLIVRYLVSAYRCCVVRGHVSTLACGTVTCYKAPASEQASGEATFLIPGVLDHRTVRQGLYFVECSLNLTWTGSACIEHLCSHSNITGQASLSVVPNNLHYASKNEQVEAELPTMHRPSPDKDRGASLV